MPKFALLPLFAAVAVFVAFVPATPNAGAAACGGQGTEVGLFWVDTDASGNWLTPTVGAYAQITESNPSLNCSTTGLYQMGQTVRELLAAEGGHYVEVGWAKKYCSAGSPCQRAFFEHQIGWNTDWQREYVFSCLNPGTRSAWQMFWNTSGWWQGMLQCYSSGSWATVDTHSDPTTAGYSDNEGFDRPDVNGNENNLVETHSVLQWLDTSRVWHGTSGSGYPGGVRCRLDQSALWNGRWLSGSSFDFVSSGGQGC